MTEAEAREAFLSPYWDFVGKNAKAAQPTKEQIAQAGLPVKESIAVDAACSGNPGLMEYRGVYTRTGEVIFTRGHSKTGQTISVNSWRLSTVWLFETTKQQFSDLYRQQNCPGMGKSKKNQNNVGEKR